MEQVEFPVLDDGHLAQEFEIGRLFSFLFFIVFFRHERGLGRHLRDEQHFLSGVELAQVLLRILIFELLRGVILQGVSTFRNFIRDFLILQLEIREGFFEENIAIKRQCQAECHESHNRQADDDRQLFTKGLEVVMLEHGSRIG